MGLSIRVFLRETFTAPASIGMGWLLLTLATLIGIDVAQFVIIFCSGIIGSYSGMSRRGGLVGSLRNRPLVNGLGGVAVVAFGITIVAVDLHPGLWVSVGTVLIGGWLVLDSIVARRLATDEHDGVVDIATLHQVIDTLSAADEPRTVEQVASECGLGESEALAAVEILHIRGMAEPRGEGYVANNVYLGRSFSVRGLFRRLSRPVRALS